MEFKRERIDTPDGDFLDLDFAPAPRTDSPVVLLLHGLEGSARRGYAIETYRALAQYGVRAVGLNFRSCSGEPNRTARFYHSGETADIGLVARLLADRFPDVPRGAVGFSLGGNALLKFLGEEGAAGAASFAAAAAISVPYDLAAGAAALDSSMMGRFYTGVFVRSLLAKAEAKHALLVDACDLDRVRAARSFHEFDDAATAPLHGFASADDYYARSSAKGFLSDIRTPTLLLQSLDDPFLPPAALPLAEIQANPNLVPVITRTGGHVGFIEGSPWRPRFWAEAEAARFLAGQLMAEPGGSVRSGTVHERSPGP
jgi:predicted alpha/beta-fold hydrolase